MCFRSESLGVQDSISASASDRVGNEESGMTEGGDAGVKVRTHGAPSRLGWARHLLNLSKNRGAGFPVALPREAAITDPGRRRASCA